MINHYYLIRNQQSDDTDNSGGIRTILVAGVEQLSDGYKVDDNDLQVSRIAFKDQCEIEPTITSGKQPRIPTFRVTICGYFAGKILATKDERSRTLIWQFQPKSEGAYTILKEHLLQIALFMHNLDTDY